MVLSITKALGGAFSTGLVATLLLMSRLSIPERPFCTCAEGDDCWPDPSQWQSLNASLNGRLIRPLPPASVCHHPNFDEAKCALVRDQWVWPEIQYVRCARCVMVTGDGRRAGEC